MIKHKVCIRDILKIKSFGKTTKSINAPEVAYYTILGDAQRLFNIDLHIWGPHWSKLNHCCNSCPTQLSHSCLIYPSSYIIYVVFVDEYHSIFCNLLNAEVPGNLLNEHENAHFRCLYWSLPQTNSTNSLLHWEMRNKLDEYIRSICQFAFGEENQKPLVELKLAPRSTCPVRAIECKCFWC